MYPPFAGIGPYAGYTPGLYGSLVGYRILVPYGTLTLTETSPPQSFTEPLDVTAMWTYLRLPSGQDGANQGMVDEITGLITAARERAEVLQNRDLVRKQWDGNFDYWPNYRVELRDPLISVDLAQYRDSDGNVTALVENTDYVVDAVKHPGAIVPPYNKMIWPVFTPWPSSAILVRFTSGFDSTSAWWSDAGSRVKLGMKMLVKAWFNKESLTDQQIQMIENLLSQAAVTRAK